ncbi:DUF2788 domain-containing protein [Aliiglaciecola sp. 3_MG-2023]|uniref:DUF2788 domain-containing protein n=1 Tax=Alteromonadaceae TaxID=72275 RepID=UPI001C08F227|nr:MULTISPECIES: DUF2788 domain-containing protein [Aliiglaciecola]MBU2877217.1 DUF2788 domain-containing protein [Aliiglaciecola lipolytica]MDO6693639.1 DUF2788 domain-containing protein [Aliiglaciecola sp. 3_MG-2023]MDO6712152.1 DUF2788 domain-containing protein [Aliiglaciecola sp. 2_MG-2023]MDO6753232.1 DUF2788 domain-containing protein [Aliiglaciecola sp. 1_MG-2023]
MLNEYYEQIEAIVLNLTLVALFALMGFAIHDVLKKNNVPFLGRAVVYLVLFLGAAGFIAKGLIQIFWENSGI